MPELATRLRIMRAELVETMAGALAGDGDWHAWLPLLAQVQGAIQAVEAVMRELETRPPRTQENANSHATENAPERP